MEKINYTEGAMICCCRSIARNFQSDGNFWCNITYEEITDIWLLKVNTHFDKLEKSQSKINWKKLRNMSTNSLLKKLVLESLMNTFLFSNSNIILMYFVILNFQTLRIFTPFLQ